jgi:hypothetical protein
VTVSPDRPCPHENFGAQVNVNRLTGTDAPGAEVTGYQNGR